MGALDRTIPAEGMVPPPYVFHSRIPSNRLSRFKFKRRRIVMGDAVRLRFRWMPPSPFPPLPSVQDAVDVAHYCIIDPSSTARFNSPGFNWSLIFIKSPDWIPRSTRSTPDALRVKRDPSVIRAVSRSKRCQSALPVPPIPMLRIPNFGSSCELAPRSIADPVRLDCLFVF